MLKVAIVYCLLRATTALTISPSGLARPVASQRCADAHMLAKKKGSASGKDVQVLLTGDIKGVGKKGEIVKVKAAYANNFIASQGLGEIATKEILDKFAAEQEEAEAQAVEAKKAAEADAAALQTAFGEEGAVVKKKVGPDGSIFGSITSAELAELIQETCAVKVDKKKISVPSISVVGSVTAQVALHKEVKAQLKVVVVADA